jgi:hypothetical protein
VTSSEKIVIEENNIGEKIILIRAILNDWNFIKTCEWDIIAADQIVYLDQFYGILDLQKSHCNSFLIEDVSMNFN